MAAGAQPRLIVARPVMFSLSCALQLRCMQLHYMRAIHIQTARVAPAQKQKSSGMSCVQAGWPWWPFDVPSVSSWQGDHLCHFESMGRDLVSSFLLWSNSSHSILQHS